MLGLNAMYLHKSPLNVAGLQIYSLFFQQLDNLECVCVQDIIYCVFMPGCNHRWSVADLMKHNFLSVCIAQAGKMNAVLDVFDLQ